MTDTKQELPEDKTEETIDETNNDAIKEFLGDDEPKKEPKEEPKEEVKEDPPEPTPPEEPKVPVEEIVEAAKAQTKEETKEAVLKALGISGKAKDAAEEAGYQTPWEKRGEDKPSSYRELLEAGTELQSFKDAEADKVEQAQKDVDAKKTKEVSDIANKEWDAQLDYLSEQKLIPQVNPDLQAKLDKGEALTQEERINDKGLVARTKLFDSMNTIATERATQGLNPITDLIHIHSRYYKPKSAPAGAKAPVSGGKVSISQPNETMSYDELHSSSFDELYSK